MALNLKKGDRVQYNESRHGKIRTGVILSKRKKTVSGGKYFCGARNRWIDAGPVQQLHIRIQPDGVDWTIEESEFYMIEKVDGAGI
jgi:hypothetical protein